MKTVKHSSKYNVGSSTSQIHVKVTVGQGQLGSSTVVVGPTLFDTVKFFDRDIGAANAIVGQKLVVVSVVSDTNQSTNRTSVTYDLKGGPHPFEHKSELTVDNDGESVTYLAEIELVS